MRPTRSKPKSSTLAAGDIEWRNTPTRALSVLFNGKNNALFIDLSTSATRTITAGQFVTLRES